ncbi:hypothetical protein ROZALSC1DRAFT_25876, partial [Rozella allomycis CSF55]
PFLIAIGKTLSELLVYADRTPEEMPGMGFEKAFGLWETLVRLLRQAQGNQVLSINDLYPSCIRKFKDLNLVLGAVPYEFVSRATVNEIKNNVFYHLGDNNPGFDLLCRTTCSRRKKFFFVYVLRRNASSHLTNEEIVDRNDCVVPSQIPENCIVLDLQSLRAAFGPSLSDRLFLQL